VSLSEFENSGITLVHNSLASADNDYTDDMRSVVSLAVGRSAQEDIARWPGYEASPLHCLDGFSSLCNVGQVLYKDESERFGLKSFKALGGSYAVAQLLLQTIASEVDETPTMDDLFSRKYADIVNAITVATATDGNHGRSVAWGAQLFGCRCVIYIHADVSKYREQKMASYGADVKRISGNYDDSLRVAAKAAAASDWIIVSDNSYEGYLEIPKYVTAGYTVMLGEIVAQLASKIPSHVFVQGGCGGLASGVCGYFWDLWGERRPRLIVVEPEQANCLQLSALEGDLVVVDGKLETLMAGLACGEVSPLAWKILRTGADDFVTLPEKYVARAMRVMAGGEGEDPSVEAGESAVAGVGVLLALARDDAARDALGLNDESSVLVLGTEGATDPELYEKLISTTEP
jgi:diaminopropionate ammonia-lyase